MSPLTLTTIRIHCFDQIQRFEVFKKLAYVALATFNNSVELTALCLDEDGKTIKIMYYTQNFKDWFISKAIKSIVKDLPASNFDDVMKIEPAKNSSILWSSFCKKFDCAVDIEELITEAEHDFSNKHYYFGKEGFRYGTKQTTTSLSFRLESDPLADNYKELLETARADNP